MEDTEQIKFWKGEFGDEYTLRNSEDFEELYKKQFGVKKINMNSMPDNSKPYDFSRFENIDFSERNVIEKIQNNLLKEHIQYCKHNSPYYKKVLHGITPEDVSLDNLINLPITEKKDIESFNDDFIAVSTEKIVDIVLSSGTTGIPTKIIYTENDLCRLAYNEAKSLKASGITSKDTVLLTCTMDRCFIAGLAYFLGLRNIGASVIRNGVGVIESHAEIINSLKPTVIVGVPTFLKKLGIFMNSIGIMPDDLNVNRLICIGEPIKDIDMHPLFVAEELQRLWGAKIYSTYASTETITTFCECDKQAGGHLLPDLAIVEIIDKNGYVLPSGNIGEVVVTPLALEGMPLIRFKTGDISFIIDTPCACRRNSLRLGPIVGRNKQMMKVQGTTIYPQSLFSVLEEADFVSDYFIEIQKESELSDQVQVFIALKEDVLGADKIISDRIKARIRVKLQINVINRNSLNERVYKSGSRKPTRFFDKRSEY